MTRQRITRTYIGGKPIMVVQRGKVRAPAPVQVEPESAGHAEPVGRLITGIAAEVAAALRGRDKFPREWWIGGGL